MLVEMKNENLPTASEMASGPPAWRETTDTNDKSSSAFSETMDQLESARAGGKIHRRYFKFLPSPLFGQTDLVFGSWWFIWGSILQALIPIPPLISLFEDWFESTSTFLPFDIHIIIYLLQVIVGLFFTVGSYAFLRAVHPALKDTPFFNPDNRQSQIGAIRKHCMTDELWGMWCFFLGILCGIPIFSIFVHYTRDHSTGFWELVLFVNIIFVLVAAFGIRICYPSNSHEEKQIISPYFKFVFGRCKSIVVHMDNDMLILSWCMYLGCIVGLIGVIGLLVIAAHHHHRREIYEYSANLVDMILFTIGSIYFTAGWYVCGAEDPETPLSPQRSSDASAGSKALAV